jgi:hypothetical protein
MRKAYQKVTLTAFQLKMLRKSYRLSAPKVYRKVVLDGALSVVFSFPRWVLLASCSLFGACAIMPELPADWAMPEQEILHHSACEVQSALRHLAEFPPPKTVFVATDWTVKFTLNPKIDADIAGSAGLTRIRPTSPKPIRLTTLVLGGSGDTKGERTGNLDFVFDAAKLIKDRTLDCENEPFALHSLSKKIGIEEWLIRSVEAATVTHSRIDKPSFSADVLMKFGGSAGYTYLFPAGTDLLGLSGLYTLDETLNVNFSAKTPVVHITAVTLPSNGRAFASQGQLAPSSITALQETRGDLQQIEQAIRNNRFNTQ